VNGAEGRPAGDDRSRIPSVWPTDPAGRVCRNDGREGDEMCANCGCGIPEDTHGDERNIRWSEVVASAEANDISPKDAIENMRTMAEQQG
jgi:ribosomal protein S26